MRILVQMLLGLAVGLAAVGVAGGVAAQTPVASPAAAEDQAAFLFVQLARGGTFTPDAADPTQAELTLEGVWPETVYFSDRPERRAGTRETAGFPDLEGLFVAEDPPNAAVVLSDPADEGGDVIVVELRDPVYDPEAGTLRYAVTVLDQAPTGLAPWAEGADPALPPRFGPVALFIDLSRYCATPAADNCPEATGGR